jgi:hypothetical protein
MEEQGNLEQAKRFSDDVKVHVSRDGAWLIIRAPGLPEAIIKPTAYFVKILERAVKKSYANAEQIKG